MKEELKKKIDAYRSIYDDLASKKADIRSSIEDILKEHLGDKGHHCYVGDVWDDDEDGSQHLHVAVTIDKPCYLMNFVCVRNAVGAKDIKVGTFNEEVQDGEREKSCIELEFYIPIRDD